MFLFVIHFLVHFLLCLENHAGKCLGLLIGEIVVFMILSNLMGENYF